jgi:murein DD-endopeptidase MepM/ murein hydrolase activator NlpD
VRREAPAAGRAPRPRLEIQIHPADIRKRVRYLFLTRRRLAQAALPLGLYLGFLLAGAALAPAVARNFLSGRTYGSLKAEHAQQGKRLLALVQHLEELHPRGQELRFETQKLSLAYGLSDEESKGLGGYPTPVAESPASALRSDIERGRQLIAETGDNLGAVEAFVREIQHFQELHLDQVRTTPSIKPLPADSFVLTSPYGARVNPFTQQRETHVGVDLASLEGTPIHATADGVVAFAGRFPASQSIGWWRYGNLVVLRHSDRFVSLYGHCAELKVRQNQKVRRGDTIATVGDTGWSSNPHLHYEVRRREAEGDYEPVDPRVYILDHRWDDQERLLIRARSAPPLTDYQPLPRLLAR